MGMWNDFVGWLTGHDMEAEEAIHENKDAVDTVVTKLGQVSTSTLAEGQKSVNEAIKALNNVNGFNDYVATIDAGAYDSLFESLAGNVNTISDTMTGAVEDIETFQNSSPLEKIFGTIGMGLCKFGEGIVSVAEDLVDGAVSIGGFITAGVADIWGGGDGVREAVGNFVKNDFSHELFAGAENYLDKYSVFTQDSAIGQGVEIAGKVVGYLYAGGLISGLGKGLGLGVKGVTSSMLNVASGTTWGATVAGFVGGTGHGTESGMIAGKSFNDAFLQDGLTSGAIQGGMAFIGGKLSEHYAGRGEAIRSAKAEIQAGDDALEAAAAAKEAAKSLPAGNQQIKAFQQAKADAAAATARKSAGEAALEAAKHNPSFQGYQDAITKAGARAGEAQGQLIKSSAQELGSKVKLANAERQFTKFDNKLTEMKNAGTTSGKEWLDTGKARAAANRNIQAAKQSLTDAQAAKDAAIHGWTDSAGNVVNGGILKENALVHGVDAVKSVPSGVAGAAKGTANFVRHPIESIKSGAASVKNVWDNGTPLLGKGGAAASVLGKGAAVVGAVPSLGVVAGSMYNQAVEPTAMERFNYGLKASVKDAVSGVPKPEVVDPESITYKGETPKTEEPTPTVPSTPPGSTPPGNNPPGNNPPGSTSTPSGTDNSSSDDTYDPGKTTTPEKEPSTQAATEPKATEPKTEAPQTEPKTETQPQTQPQTVPITVPPSTEPASIPSVVPEEGGNNNTYDPGYTHGGGEYSDEGYNPSAEATSNELEGADKLAELDESDDEFNSDDLDNDSALDNIINSSKYNKVPSSTSQSSKKSGSSSVIPIAAGLSVAAAAGIGAKAYLDRKNNNDFDEEEDEYDGEYEDDSFESEEYVDENENFTPDFSDPSLSANVDEGDLSDEYYQDNGGSYSARSADELADMQ